MSLPAWFGSSLDSLIEPEVASIVGGVSLLMVAASLALIPWLLCRLPVDYLLFKRQPRHGLVRRVAQNGLGALLVLLGILMLVLPGQGLLSILVGLMLLDFPRKRRILRRALSRPRVIGVINRIRQRFGRAPLEQVPRD